MKEVTYLLRVGDLPGASNPEIMVVEDGPRTYIWLGNGMYCFGTLDGIRLRSLTKRLMRAFGWEK